MYQTPNMPKIAEQYIQVPFALVEADNLTPNEFRTLCAIKTNEPGYPHYYHGHLDEQTGLDRATVKRNVDKLITKGYIQSIERIDNQYNPGKQNCAGFHVVLNLELWDIPENTRYAELSNALCRNGEITPVEFRVLAWLRAQNGIKTSPYAIRNALGIMQPAVLDALDRLLANKVLEIDGLQVGGHAKDVIKRKEHNKGRLTINDAVIQRIVKEQGQWTKEPTLKEVETKMLEKKQKEIDWDNVNLLAQLDQ